MHRSIILGLVVIFACLLEFGVLRRLMPRIPWDSDPAERFRWPIRRWLPAVLIGALVSAQAFNLWLTWGAAHPGVMDRALSSDELRNDIRRVRGVDRSAPKPLAPREIPGP